MTRFKDGPAKGQTLMLKRAARFLRVTYLKGKWDGLDQLEDTPLPGESVYVYEIVGRPGHAFIDDENCRGLYPIAEYFFVKEQPALETLFDNEEFDGWCRKRAKLKPRKDI